MSGFFQEGSRSRARRTIVGISLVLALIVTTVVSVGVIAETAAARGPAYDGPTTPSKGPAFFGPAPNPFPYCDSPSYFDPFPENVTPIGSMDIGDTASVTTDGITMDLTITAEGNPGTTYPGFFDDTDRAKGIELAEGDAAVVELSAPLFYSQWIFTDVDQPGEGFTVSPTWTVPGEAAAFGGDDFFTFEGSTNSAVVLDDVDGIGTASEVIEGRVQVDFLGAVTGISMQRTFPSEGQSGFAVGGGCEAAGAAKTVVAGPTWNGTSYDVTYELRMRNNLPNAATIQSVITDAQNAVGTSLVTGAVQGIDLMDLQLTDDLADTNFSSIVVTGASATGNLVLLDSYNGLDSLELIESGSIAAESEETITLSVQYTPDLVQPVWATDACATGGYTYLNQSEITGQAANVPVADLSDNGVSASPADDNGEGGVDDPTPVLFPCPPGDLEIVKTALAGAGATCPAFAAGVVGEGDPVSVTRGDTVTYCISVTNGGPGPVFDVEVVDAQAPSAFTLDQLEVGESATFSYELVVDLATPERNTATATGVDSEGPVDPVSDDALISVADKLQPNVEIVKTVVSSGTECPSFDVGIVGLGPALAVDDGTTVTYCISVRNIGAGPAVNVMITDPQAPEVYDIGTLEPGAGADRQYDITVTTTTPTTNVATVDYLDADGQPLSADDPAQIDVVPLEPNLEIVKTVLAGASRDCPDFAGGVAGLGDALPVSDRDTVTYCVTVRNVGPGIATDVVVTDTQAPGPFPTIDTLGVDATETFTYNVTVDLLTPTVNTAAANGNGPAGPLAEVQDQAQIAISALPDPVLEIVKTAVRGPGGTCPDFGAGTVGEGTPVRFLEGETVTYCISVWNSGEGAATNVVIADDQAPDTVDLNIGDLGIGEGATRSYDVLLDADSPRSIVNIASTQGEGPNGPVGPVEDPALVEVTQQPDPILEIVKTAVAGGADNCPATFDDGTAGDGDAVGFLHGEVVTYCVIVRNVGGNDATDVVVNDDQAPGPIQLGTIPVGEERSDSYDVTVDADTPAQNVASASGQGPNGPIGPVVDTALIETAPQPNPVLEIVKTAVAGPNGLCPEFDEGIQGPGDAVIFEYDTVVTYCITVRNTGGNTATAVVITDPQAPAPFEIGDLPVGETRTRSYDLVVGAETPAENVATVTGVGPNGPLDPVQDPAIITPTPLADPILQIVKTVVVGPDGDCPDTFAAGIDGPGDPLATGIGDTVTYCLAVRNDGVGTATNVQINDDQAEESPFEIGTLTPGTGDFVQYDVLVTTDTDLVNTAVATGTGPNGPVRDDDSSLIELDERVANIGLVHSVSTADEDCITESKALNSLVANIEDLPITWCAEITNTGNVPLTNVTLLAPDLGITEALDTSEVTGVTILLPGESVVLGFDGAIPDTGLLSTGVAEADPSDADGNVIDLPRPSDIDTAEVREASINLETTVTAGANGDCAEASEEAVVPVGADITWCFAVTNTGAIDLLVDEVSDITLGITVPIPEELRRLVPGQTIVVSVNDIADEGGMVNDAEVFGQPLDVDGTVLDQAPVVEDEDPASVRTPEANLAIVKSVNAANVTQGAAVTYSLVVTNEGPDAAVEVVVRDSLPSGLRYLTVPGVDGWACALDDDERGFSCLKATPLANGESATLSYIATTASAVPGTDFTNVATVESVTPDPDLSDNEDDETVRTSPPLPLVPEEDPPLEFPGPFDPPEAEPVEPDEVLGLAITGAASNLFAMLAAAMMAIGGVFTVGARRSDRDDE